MRLNRFLPGMTAGDFIVLGMLLAGGGIGLAAVAGSVSPGTMVIVEVDGTAVEKLSLTQPSLTTIHGRRGSLQVEVRSGNVAVTSADCPNHVCVRTGWRSHAGEVIVCVPNRVIVKILGKQREGVHAITG